MYRQSSLCWLAIATICPQVFAVSSVRAEPASRITEIKADRSGDRLNLMVNFVGSERPQIAYANQGKTWIATLNGAQLKLANGNATFAKVNPAPGIAAIEAMQAAANKVQIRVTSTNPIAGDGRVSRKDTTEGILFSLATNETAATQASPGSSPKVARAVTSTSPLFQPQVTITSTNGMTRVAQQVPPQSPPKQPTQPPSPTQVTPRVPGRVQGVVPPYQRRPVPPPVGDISISNSNLRSDIIDLGSAERVPKISLREAPVREVLTLIARVAGLNVAFTDDAGGGQAGAAPGATPGANPANSKISLDIENETAQEVFNNVLRLTNLDANRIGRTIFVASRLPNSLRNNVTRTLRLNQIAAGEAANFLVAMGAERAVVRTRPVTSATTLAVGTAAQQVSTQTTTETTVTVDRLADSPDSGAPVLRGLQVIAEDRGNSITLVGAPSKVDFAAAQLARLDIRKRQVAVNVRVVDVNLAASQRSGSNSSFGIGDSFFTIRDGVAVANFGQLTPAGASPTTGGQFTRPVTANPLAGATLYVNPDGTELVRDAQTGNFIPRATQQPGSPFSSDGSPLTPVITGFDASAPGVVQSGGRGVLPAQANQATRITVDPTTGQAVINAASGQAGTATTYYLNPGGTLNSQLAGLNPTFKNGPFANTPIKLDPVTGAPIVATQGTTAVAPANAGTNTPGNVLQNFAGQAAQFIYSLPDIIQAPKQFLARLEATIQNGHAKVLTDPTLTVQEGETGTVSLVQEVSGGVIREFQNVNGQTLSSERVNIRKAGLTLNVKIERIDDNGFVNLSLAPVVSVPSQEIQVNQFGVPNSVTLLVERSLNSGNVRLRDNQTLILSGVIQDSDRKSVQKVPFFGDLPIIGSLFRSESSTNTRNEVIIIVTPRIIDDGERANWGYTYQPGPEVQKVLDSNRIPFQ